MGKNKATLLALAVAFLAIGILGYLNGWFNQSSKQEFILDMDGILSRGTLRVAVDNNSSSFYIYRGRLNLLLLPILMKPSVSWRKVEWI
jgi:membrane-bound lytic murein transglycosylase F